MIEEILASKVKIKILRFFFEYTLSKRNVREVAKECKIGFGVAAKSLKELSFAGIVKMEKIGREMVYSLNIDSKMFDPLKKLFELEKESLGNLPFIYRNLIADVITSTKELAESCILFGSLVSGSFTSKSDVDLLFISSKEEKIREKCLRLEERYGVRLQAIVIKREDIKNFRKSSLYKTIAKESVLLFGEGIE